MNIGIVGIGNIGGVLYEKATKEGWKTNFVADSKGIYSGFDRKRKFASWNEACNGVDLAFIAIPNYDGGAIATAIIKEFLKRGVKVVSAEKGSTGNHYAELVPYFDRFAFGAALGGGVGMIENIRNYDSSKINEIHAVVNGTINYIFDGNDIEKRTEDAQNLGYAEPGAMGAFEVIKLESNWDVPAKTSNLFNESRVSKHIIRARDIVKFRELKREDLEKIVSEKRKFVVSITKGKLPYEYVGGFSHKVGGWNINAGFRELNGKDELTNLDLRGVGNSLVILNKYRQYLCISGQGAGADPTTDIMIKDSKRLMSLK